MRKLVIAFILFSFTSCIAKKYQSDLYNKIVNVNQVESIENALEGLTSYLLVPVKEEKIAFTSNFGLCNILLKNSNRISEKECYAVLIEFYASNNELELDQIVFERNIHLLDLDVLGLYNEMGVNKILKMSYDEKCLPIIDESHSQSAEQAAALILLGLNLVRDDFSGSDFHLSTLSSEKYCK